MHDDKANFKIHKIECKKSAHFSSEYLWIF